MNTLIPSKLKKGDHIQVIAPARSLGLLSEETKQIANNRLKAMGFELSFGAHVAEMDDFASSSIESRLEDLHAAFTDKTIQGILTVIGGFNSNQLLQYIDWELIRNNPKVFCGYSDITALNNSIFAKTGLVTYSGPHYSTFGQKLYFEYTQAHFEQTVMSAETVMIQASKHWFDDAWYINQEQRNAIENPGFVVVNEGQVEGTVLGANLCTFNLLQGTDFMPSLKNAVLFLEDDYESRPHHFDRDLQSLIHLPDFAGVKGLVIGRFQIASEMTKQLLFEIIRSKKQLSRIPVMANVDFGHTDPKITIPIGGTAKIVATENAAEIVFTKH